MLPLVLAILGVWMAIALFVAPLVGLLLEPKKHPDSALRNESSSTTSDLAAWPHPVSVDTLTDPVADEQTGLLA